VQLQQHLCLQEQLSVQSLSMSVELLDILEVVFTHEHWSFLGENFSTVAVHTCTSQQGLSV